MISGVEKHIIIEARNLARNFRIGESDVPAIRDVSVGVTRGEFLALLGRSGSGKTTLLNLLGGLDIPSKGSVTIDGEELTTMSDRDRTLLRRHKLGFVFQSYGLLALLSAYENVELPLRINGVSWRQRRHLVNEALQQVGLGARARHRPFELSGGEQQRVAIARALANKPVVLLADEPTGDLDFTTGAAIGKLLRNLATEQGITIITATHDLSLANMADKIIELIDGAVANVTVPSRAAWGTPQN